LWQQAWRSGVKVDRNLLGVFGVGLLAVQVALELPSNRPGSRMIGVLCGVRVSCWVTTFFVLSGSTSRSARTWSTIAESICLRPAAGNNVLRRGIEPQAAEHVAQELTGITLGLE